MSELKFNKYTSLNELIEYCSLPRLLADRVKNIKHVVEVYPFFYQFLLLTFRSDKAFDVSDLNIPDIKIIRTILANSKGYSDITLDSWFRIDLPYICNKSIKLKFRNGRIVQSLDYMKYEDVKLLIGMFNGVFDYQNDKINILILKQAFPDDFSNVKKN